MITRFNRYPGGKILGFGATPKMQKRNCYGPSDAQFLSFLGFCAVIPPLAIYLAYKSYKYFHNNYEIKIVRKTKIDDKNTHSNKDNISENNQPVRRPGGIGSNGE